MSSRQFRIINNIFEDELIERLIETLPNDVRKQRWDLSKTSRWPEALQKAQLEIFSKIPEVTKINTAILKKYSSNDASTAYVLHRDPEEFLSEPLVLVTLSGKARMKVKTSSVNEFFVSTADCVILINPALAHAVSKPLGSSKMRHILFFGYSSNK